MCSLCKWWTFHVSSLIIPYWSQNNHYQHSLSPSFPSLFIHYSKLTLENYLVSVCISNTTLWKWGKNTHGEKCAWKKLRKKFSLHYSLSLLWWLFPHTVSNALKCDRYGGFNYSYFNYRFSVIRLSVLLLCLSVCVFCKINFFLRLLFNFFQLSIMTDSVCVCCQ